MKTFKQYLENKNLSSLSYGGKSLVNWKGVAHDYKKNDLKEKEQDLLKKLELLKDPMGRYIGFNAHSAQKIMEKLKEIRKQMQS